MRRGRKSGRSRRGAGRRGALSMNVDVRKEVAVDISQNIDSSICVSGDETSCDFEGFDPSSVNEECGIKIEQFLAPEVAWDAIPDSTDSELVRNESLNSSHESFETLHEPLSFEADVKLPSDADQKSWEAVFGDHVQLNSIVTPALVPTSADQLVTSSTLKSSPQSVCRVSVPLNRIKEEILNVYTRPQSQNSSRVPIWGGNSKKCEEFKRRPRGRGRGRSKTKLVRQVKAFKKELDDKDLQDSPAQNPISVPSFKPTVSSPVLQPAKRHRYALKFRERPEPFVMDPGYLQDLKYLESLRPKNFKEERDLLAKLNIIYNRHGTDNFPHLLHGLRRKLIVRQEQRENGLPVFDVGAIEKFLTANGRVPTNDERLRMEFVKAAANAGTS